MKKAAFLACAAAANAAFALGYAMAMPWYSELAVLACALCWLLAWRRIPSLCLGSSTIVAAFGAILSAPMAAMLVGLSISLGLWDFARSTVPGASPEKAEREARSYERHRLPWLALALGIGSAAAIVGSTLSLSIPFYAMAACALACAAALDRIAFRLRGDRARR